MLSWFREWSRPIASAALLSLVTLTLSSAVPHSDDCHGAECGPIALHDPSDHSVSRSQESSGQPDHCLVCHWTRSARPTPEAQHLFAPTVAEDVRVAIDVVNLPSQSSLAQPSLRAPPAAPVLA
jgi:hypothetical protein